MPPRCLCAFVAVFLGIATACSGTMQGVVRDGARTVQFNYSNSKVGTASLRVVMPGGERFEGLVERGTTGTAPDSGATASMDRFEAVETFDGNAEAVLSGNRGNIMQCRFLLADTIIGLKSGGFGVCQLADGRVIDIFF